MQITQLGPTRFDLPGRADPVYIAAQQWELEPWEGEDPPDLGRSWAIKPKFAVNGKRSCAELAIVHQLRDKGWHGFWVCAYGTRELRSEWFPAPAVKAIAQTGAPLWAVEIFDRLRMANGGKLDGFFDVFAWREPGEVRFDEAKTSGDSPRPSQRKFVKLALDLGHRLEQFTIIKVPTTPSPRSRIRTRPPIVVKFGGRLPGRE
jgi:hypothetical protein